MSMVPGACMEPLECTLGTRSEWADAAPRAGGSIEPGSPAKVMSSFASGSLQTLPEQAHTFEKLPILWLRRAVQLEENGRDDEALDVIYRNVDQMLLEGHFALCDQLLGDLDPSKLSVDLTVAFLTITLAARGRLRNRPEFFHRAAQQLASQPDVHQLLSGLE